MYVIRTESDLQELEGGDLLELIHRRIADTAEFADHFSELVSFVIVEPCDDAEHLALAIGFSPLVNRFDGTCFGEPGFTPSWDVLEEHAGFYELTYVLSDDGRGVTVFVTRAEGVSPALLAMCRQFATSEAGT